MKNERDNGGRTAKGTGEGRRTRWTGEKGSTNRNGNLRGFRYISRSGQIIRQNSPRYRFELVEARTSVAEILLY